MASGLLTPGSIDSPTFTQLAPAQPFNIVSETSNNSPKVIIIDFYNSDVDLNEGDRFSINLSI